MTKYSLILSLVMAILGLYFIYNIQVLLGMTYLIMSGICLILHKIEELKK